MRRVSPSIVPVMRAPAAEFHQRLVSFLRSFDYLPGDVVLCDIGHFLPSSNSLTAVAAVGTARRTFVRRFSLMTDFNQPESSR